MRSMRWSKGVMGLTVLVGLLFVGRARAAEEKSAPQLLPPWTLVYAELRDPAKAADFVLNHPLYAKLHDAPDVRKALETPQFKRLASLVEAIEKRAGADWKQVLDGAAGGGVYIGFDPITQGIALLVKPRDMKSADAVQTFLLETIPRDNAGKSDEVRSETYRDFTIQRYADVALGHIGPWLAYSNKPKLVQLIANRYLDSGPSLAEDVTFIEARKLQNADEKSAWAMVRLAPLRLLGVGKEAFGKSDNPAAEMLIGGLVSILKESPYLTAGLALRPDGAAKLTLSSPFDANWVGEQRKFFFALPGAGAEPAFDPPGMLASFTTYRNAAAMWQAAPDLFVEGVAAKLAQADSGLSVFFGGKNFSSDVLGALGPQVQFIVTRQDYKAAGVPQPTLRLPAGALIIRLTDRADAIRRYFRVAFQSIVSIGNLDGASKGRPMLEMQTHSADGIEVFSATYAPEDAPKPGDALKEDVHYNFSPSMVLSHDHVMLCSTKQIADQLAAIEKQRMHDGVKPITDNTRIEADAGAIAGILRDNRDQLIAKNMLEKGIDRASAERQIDLLLSVVDSMKGLSVRLAPAEKSISLELSVEAKK